MKRKYQATEDSPTVDISSLIDVCFLLLIYFIVTSTIAEPESDLILQLPSDNPTERKRLEVDPARFHIAENGVISQVGVTGEQRVSGAGLADISHRTPEDMPDLLAHVDAYSKMAGDQAAVMVTAHNEVPAQYVIDFLNVLSEKRITKITFTQ